MSICMHDFHQCKLNINDVFHFPVFFNYHGKKRNIFYLSYLSFKILRVQKETINGGSRTTPNRSKSIWVKMSWDKMKRQYFVNKTFSFYQNWLTANKYAIWPLFYSYHFKEILFLKVLKNCASIFRKLCKDEEQWEFGRRWIWTFFYPVGSFA